MASLLEATAARWVKNGLTCVSTLRKLLIATAASALMAGTAIAQDSADSFDIDPQTNLPIKALNGQYKIDAKSGLLIRKRPVLTDPALNSQAACEYTDGDFFIKDYPVSRKRSVFLSLRDKLTCGTTSAKLFCMAGSCQVYPDSGKYGFNPGERSSVSIDGKRWSWIGDPPGSIGFQMWKAIKNGSRFAYELSHWVSEYPTGVNTVFIPSGLKDRIYKMSLHKP